MSVEGGSGGFEQDGDFAEEASQKRMKYDSKTGEYKECEHGEDDKPEDDFFAAEEAGEGEQFMAVRPWIGQIAEPDNHNPVSMDKPDETYALEYVFGYRSADSRQNVHLNCEGKVVYMTAALGVVLDHTAQPPQQKFFGGGEVDNTAKNVANDTNAHTDDIMAVSICEQRQTAVSGQVGRAPAMFTWDAVTGEKKQRFKCARGSRGLSAVGISCDGAVVAGADLHNDHRVHCFDAESGALKFMEKGATDKIMDLAFDRAPGSNRFATVGVKNVSFWTVDGQKEGGLFGSTPRTSFSCCAFDTKGRCFAGGANGKLYCFEGRSATSAQEAHKGYVCGIKCVGENLMLTGGKDGKVKLWNTDDLSCTREWQFDSLVRAVDMFADQSAMVVGLRNGNIIAVNLADDSQQVVMRSHSDGEVWGLQVDEAGVWTSGDDNRVMLWDAAAHAHCKEVKVTERREKQRKGRGASTLSKYPQSQQSRAVATNAEWIAISGNDGKVSVRAKSDPETEVHLLKDAAEWNECMAFSPCGTYFAVGSHDNLVYVYTVADWALAGKLKGHSSFIVAFDWSADSSYIRSNCGAHEILYFTIPSCAQDTSGRSNTTGTEWATASVHFTWSNEAIFPSGTDGTHVNGVAQAPDGNTLLVGNDYGLVQLFRNPARNGAQPRSYRGHSEHVVRVAYSADGSYAYSVGGYDQTMMVWKKC